LNHAEHTVKLPAYEKKNNEKMMGIPESFEVGPALFFKGEEDHDSEGDGHNPASDPRSGGKVGAQEGDDTWTCTFRVGVCQGEFGKVYHVGDDVDSGPEYYGPGRCLVEGNVLVKLNRRRETKFRQMGINISAAST
jgi:hypothetical protein